MLDLNPYEKGLISKVYTIIQHIKPLNRAGNKAAWEEDIGEELSEEIWEDSIARIHTSSLSIRHGLIQFKVLH